MILIFISKQNFIIVTNAQIRKSQFYKDTTINIFQYLDRGRWVLLWLEYAFLKEMYLPGHTLDALIGFPPERGSTLKEVGSRAVYFRGPFTADRSWVAIVARVRFPQTSCKYSGSGCPTHTPLSNLIRFIQGNQARKGNCCCVFSEYILKPVLYGRCL